MSGDKQGRAQRSSQLLCCLSGFILHIYSYVAPQSRSEGQMEQTAKEHSSPIRCHWCWHPFRSDALDVKSNLSLFFVVAVSCVRVDLPAVLVAAWCAFPYGQSQTSSPRRDAWSGNSLQKPAQTQRQRHKEFTCWRKGWPDEKSIRTSTCAHPRSFHKELGKKRHIHPSTDAYRNSRCAAVQTETWIAWEQVDAIHPK